MFIPLTETDRQLHAKVIASEVEGLTGAIQLGNPNGKLQVALSYGTHLKEARVIGLALEWMLRSQDFLQSDVGLLIVCSFPKGVELAFESDDQAVWKAFRAYPGSPDGNRLPQILRGTDDYVLNRVADIRELFTRRGVKYLIDVHATDGSSTPGYLGCAGDHAHHAPLIPYIGVDHYFTDVGKVQLEQGTKTYTFSSASGAQIGSEIEVGQTGTQTARDYCLRLIRDWGIAVGAMKGEKRLQGKQTGYKMVASYLAPSADFEVANKRLLEDLASVKSGEPVLINRKTGETVNATSDQLLTWAPGDIKLAPEDLGSEIFFGCVEA